MNYLRRITCFLLLFATCLLCLLSPAYAAQATASVLKPDLGVIAGEWQRTDGGYLIKVDNIKPDGQAKVEYFNPRPINVEQAAISREKGLIRLFIKFQDKGYEGSTYTLFYYVEKDAMAGFYYQAAMDRTYEVIFMRKDKAD